MISFKAIDVLLLLTIHYNTMSSEQVRRIRRIVKYTWKRNVKNYNIINVSTLAHDRQLSSLWNLQRKQETGSGLTFVRAESHSRSREDRFFFSLNLQVAWRPSQECTSKPISKSTFSRSHFFWLGTTQYQLKPSLFACTLISCSKCWSLLQSKTKTLRTRA